MSSAMLLGWLTNPGGTAVGCSATVESTMVL